MRTTSPTEPDRTRIALTGATGYVGGRLAQRLLGSGHDLHCLVRSKQKLEARSWSQHERVSIGTLDMLDVDRMTEEMTGCKVAYYLIHSMQSTRDYAEHDRKLATNFARAAHRAGVERIIYLGGLGEMEEGLQSPPAVQTRSRTVPGKHPGAGDDIPSRHDHRIRVGLVRDPAVPRERLPVMVTPEVGQDESPSPSPSWMSSTTRSLLDSPRIDRTNHRHRRLGGGDLSGTDARHGRRTRTRPVW